MNEIREENINQQVEQYNSHENEREYIQNIPQSNNRREADSSSPFTKRIKRGAAILMVSAIAALIILGNTSTHKNVNTSQDAVEALETHVSTTLEAGTRLLAEDDNYIGGDLTITHDFQGDETNIWVWDYAAEDGDYVQVLVDGNPLGEPFMITNKAVKFSVPAVGEVQVVGTRDGGGGITYGIYYELNHTTYFNGVDEGGNNTYTLIRN